MKIFYCKLCKAKEQPCCFTRKGFREHLRKEHRIMSSLTKSNLWNTKEL